MNHNRQQLKKVYQDAKRKGIDVPLLPEHEITDKNKMKVYSAEEALAERTKREKLQSQRVNIVNDSFVKPAENQAPSIEQVQTDLLMEYSEPLGLEQDTMVLQSMRYIIGPTLEFPIEQMKVLFGWNETKRHPLTNEVVEGGKYKVFYYYGDRGEDLLKNKKEYVALIWHEIDIPEFSRNDEGQIIGLKNNWKLLFDDDTEYPGDPIECKGK